MKTLLIAVAAAGLMLTACSSTNNPAENEAPATTASAPQITVEEAMAQCQQAGGQTQDRATFDACMKDKGFQRNADQAPAAGAASAAH